jgi:hypothetical protein
LKKVVVKVKEHVYTTKGTQIIAEELTFKGGELDMLNNENTGTLVVRDFGLNLADKLKVLAVFNQGEWVYWRRVE